MDIIIIIMMMQCNETWYDHSAEAVMENDQVKLLWEFRIQTDHHLDHNRGDIKSCWKRQASLYELPINIIDYLSRFVECIALYWITIHSDRVRF